VHERKHAVEVLEQVVGLVHEHVVVLEHMHAFQDEAGVVGILGLFAFPEGGSDPHGGVGELPPLEAARGVGRATRRAVAAGAPDEGLVLVLADGVAGEADGGSVVGVVKVQLCHVL
jgi:hypothetical protein